MAVAAVDQQLGPARSRARRRGQHHLQSLVFLVPGAILLLAIVIWPAIATIRYSFYNADRDQGSRALQLQVIVLDRRHSDCVP